MTVKRIGTVKVPSKREVVTVWIAALVLTGIPWLYLVWILVKELAS